MNENKMKNDTKENMRIKFLVFPIIIGIISAIIFGICIYEKPATKEDYQALEDQIIAIQKVPSTLLQFPGTIVVDDDTFTITLENEKCRVSRELNSKTFEFVSEEFQKVEKSRLNSGWRLAIIANLIGILFGTMTFYVKALIWKRKTGDFPDFFE